MTTANPLIVAALRDNSELIRKFGADLRTMPSLWGRYQRNRDLILSGTVKASAKRKEIAA